MNYLVNHFFNNDEDVSGIALSFDDTPNAASWKAYDDDHGQGYNWKASFSLYSTGLASQSANINSLYDNGHELANHSIQSSPAPPDYLDTHTEEEYYNEYILPVDVAIQAIVSGFGTTKSYVWPFGDEFPAVNDYLIANNKMRITRDVQDVSYPFYYDGSTRILGGYVTDELSGWDLDDWKGYIDIAKAQNKVLISLGHEIVTSGASGLQTDQTLLNGICEYIIEKNMEFYRLDELTEINF